MKNIEIRICGYAAYSSLKSGRISDNTYPIRDLVTVAQETDDFMEEINEFENFTGYEIFKSVIEFLDLEEEMQNESISADDYEFNFLVGKRLAILEAA